MWYKTSPKPRGPCFPCVRLFSRITCLRILNELKVIVDHKSRGMLVISHRFSALIPRTSLSLLRKVVTLITLYLFAILFSLLRFTMVPNIRVRYLRRRTLCSLYGRKITRGLLLVLMGVPAFPTLLNCTGRRRV